MNNIKKYLKSIGIAIGLILIFSIILTIFNYLDLINNNIYKILLITFTIISVFISSYILGNQSIKKGYLEGIKLSSIIIIIFFIISYLAFNEGINISSFIYYLIIIATSSIGAMFGINKKKKS